MENMISNGKINVSYFKQNDPTIQDVSSLKSYFSQRLSLQRNQTYILDEYIKLFFIHHELYNWLEALLEVDIIGYTIKSDYYDHAEVLKFDQQWRYEKCKPEFNIKGKENRPSNEEYYFNRDKLCTYKTQINCDKYVDLIITDE